MKNPLTPAGIESATFRFVAQQLNQCATAVATTLSIVHESRRTALPVRPIKYIVSAPP